MHPWQLWAADVALTILSMWLASKLTALPASLREIAIPAMAAALVALIPGFSGWLLSIVVLFGLLRRFTEAPLFPDIALMVVVSRALWLLMSMSLLRAAV